jgi:hypothetical protein
LSRLAKPPGGKGSVQIDSYVPVQEKQQTPIRQYPEKERLAQSRAAI